MAMGLRKLIGTFATVLFVTIYALLAMLLAVRLLPGSSSLAATIYYVVAGLVWVIPVGWLIRWMERS